MLIVHVSVRVKPECTDAFVHATIENARESLREPGVRRFDFIRSEEEPDRFMLVEGYRDNDASAAHKESAHYKKWRDTVADMMAEPRSSKRYQGCFVPLGLWQS
jgi:quinol monooxygenase YgiN